MRFAIVIAGAIYLGGAIVTEAIGGSYSKINGEDNLIYNAIATVEEMLEMAGVILFIRALLNYLANYYPDVRIQFGNRQPDALSSTANANLDSEEFH